MVYMNGIYFALRSGKEHRELRFNSSQITLVERDGEWPFLQYTEDESKNRPGGLKGCRIGRKIVKHHANISDRSRCFVRLFSVYRSHCPTTPKCNCFYLQCLKKPTDTLWFSNEPLGHNTLQNHFIHVQSSRNSRVSNKPFATCNKCNSSLCCWNRRAANHGANRPSQH